MHNTIYERQLKFLLYIKHTQPLSKFMTCNSCTHTQQEPTLTCTHIYRCASKYTYNITVRTVSLLSSTYSAICIHYRWVYTVWSKLTTKQICYILILLKVTVDIWKILETSRLDLKLCVKIINYAYI